MIMLSWQVRLWMDIIHAAGRIFVTGAFTPSIPLLICFLPMPIKLVTCVLLPPATISSVPVHDFNEANEELADEETEAYYPCCGKSIYL
jgi:hypothetical protein